MMDDEDLGAARADFFLQLQTKKRRARELMTRCATSNLRRCFEYGSKSRPPWVPNSAQGRLPGREKRDATGEIAREVAHGVVHLRARRTELRVEDVKLREASLARVALPRRVKLRRFAAAAARFPTDAARSFASKMSTSNQFILFSFSRASLKKRPV